MLEDRIGPQFKGVVDKLLMDVNDNKDPEVHQLSLRQPNVSVFVTCRLQVFIPDLDWLQTS